MAESQIADFQNARVLLEDAMSQVENLSEHRRARLELPVRAALREVDDRLRDLARDLGVLRVVSSRR